MGLLLQQIANGLIIGSTYAVVALGFSLAFTVLRVINFAHPDIFMVGMFAGLVFALPGPWGLSCVGRRHVRGGGGRVGAGTDRHLAVARPRRADDLIGTLGVAIMLENGDGADRWPRPGRLPQSRAAPIRRYRPGDIDPSPDVNFAICLILLAL